MSDTNRNQLSLEESAVEDLARPGLTLVLGPANSGKMGRVLEWWRRRLTLGPVVVAPTGPDSQELTLEMVRRAGALVGVSPALTFDGLVAEVLGRRPRYSSSFQRYLILRRILDEIPLSGLEPMVKFPGTLAALSLLLQRLEESGRTGSQIENILQTWAGSDPAAADLAADVARAARSYEAMRAVQGLTDRPAAVRAASARADLWEHPVALYGFTSFTPGHRAFVEALSRHVPVMLTLPFERSRPFNLANADEVLRWETLAREVIELASQAHAYSSPAIEFLERNFMRAPAGVAPPAAHDGPQGVRFLLASGQRNEAELAAEQIAELIRGGFAPGRIGVVVRHVDAWSGLLSQVFDSCGIPFRIDTGRRFRATGLGHAFLSALQGWADDDAQALLAFLRSPYSGIDLGTVAQRETEYRRGFPRGAAALASLFGREERGSLLRLEEAVSGHGKDAHLDISSLDALALGMLTAGLRGLPAVSRAAEEDVRAYSVLATAVSVLKEMSKGGEEGGWLAVRVVLASLDKMAVPSGPMEGQEAVQILSPHRARARRFDALLILGLVEGEFPARLDPPSLLTEAQRTRIDSIGGGGVLPPEVDSEAALFANAISRPWQMLYLSARDADDGGSEAAPSEYWLHCMDLLRPEREADCRRTLAHLVFATGVAPTQRHFLRARAVGARTAWGTLETSTTLSVAPWEREGAVLRHPAVLADLAGKKTFSSSELEKYLGCPFGWFLNNIGRVDQVDSELDGRELGNIAHSALCATYRELARRRSLPVVPANLAEAIDVGCEAVGRLVEDGTCPGSASDKRVAAWRVRKMVEALLRFESTSGGRLVAVDTELWFGGWEGVDIGGLVVRGKIDRVDADPEGTLLFVIDYKTGSIPSFSEMGTEKGLQLPLYLLALAAERPEARVIGGAYLSLKDLSRSGIVSADRVGVLGKLSQGCRPLDEEAEEGLLGDALATATTAAGGIRSGLIAPLPGRKCPLWCELGPACRARIGGRAR
jgi:hypothetical protein